MSLIEQLEKISAKLFQQSVKTYQLKDVIAHRKAKPHNLNEHLSFYPNKGVGFHVFKKNWPSSLYIKVTAANFKSHRFGKILGMEYKDGVPQWKMPKKLSGASKRGIWTYSIGEAKSIKLDNGVVYTPADYQAYMQLRKSMTPVQKVVPQPVAEQPSEAVASSGEVNSQQASK